MKRFARVAALGFTFSFTLLYLACTSSQPSSESASGSSGGPTYMFCFSSPTAQVVRLSGTFKVKPTTQVEALEEPWAKDFRRYLGQSGNEGGISVTCTPISSKDPQGALKDKAESLRKEGHKVIETGWTYAGG